jgi:hypothetical protein
MRTSTVLLGMLIILVAFAFAGRQLSPYGYIAAYVFVAAVEMWLVLVVLGNCIVSLLIVPSQLTSRAPGPKIKRILDFAAGPQFMPWADAAQHKQSFQAAFPANYKDVQVRAQRGWNRRLIPSV